MKISHILLICFYFKFFFDITLILKAIYLHIKIKSNQINKRLKKIFIVFTTWAKYLMIKIKFLIIIIINSIIKNISLKVNNIYYLNKEYILIN